MHGIIHLELRNFVVQHHGEAAWRALTDKAGLSSEIYTPLRSYPDEQRVSPSAIAINYDSPRKLCAVARGIARGVATHFSEQLSISDERCMHRGDRECVMLFTLMEAQQLAPDRP